MKFVMNLDCKQNLIRQQYNSTGVQLLVPATGIHHPKKKGIFFILQHGCHTASPASAKGLLPGEDSTHYDTKDYTNFIEFCFNSCHAFYIVLLKEKLNYILFLCVFSHVSCRGAVPVVLHRQKLRLMSPLCHPRARKANSVFLIYTK